MSFDLNRPIVQSILTHTRNGAVDAFGRHRVSSPFSLFDSKQIFDEQPLFFDLLTTGTAQVNYVSGESKSRLSVSNDNDLAIRQTKRYFPYQSGKSLQILMSFNMLGEDSNVKKQIGYFDGYNGLFLMLDENGPQVVKRSDVSGSVIDEVVPQENWTIDTMDSYGPSGVTIDLEKVQLLIIDIEWLGTGSVRFGFVINGVTHYVHEFHASNIIDTPYMRNANLPLRFEIEATGQPSGESNLDSICATVISEGGHQPVGIIRAADMGTTSRIVDNTLTPLISIRLKESHKRATIFPNSLSVVSLTNVNFRWTLLLNPTITGGASANWVSAANAYVEYDIDRDGSVSGGIRILSGYAPNNASAPLIPLETDLPIVSDINGVPDELVLAVQTIGDGEAGSDSFVGGLNWGEVT